MLVGWPITLSPPERLPASFGRCDPALYPLPQEMVLELRQRRYEGGDQLTLRGGQIERQSGLRYERDVLGR